MNSLLIFILSVMSFVVGWFVRIQFPEPINRWLCSSFVSFFGIEMDEAEMPLKSYKSIEDVFTRKLKKDVRPIMSELVSPAEGTLSISAPAIEQQAVQVKGRNYDLGKLIGLRSSDQIDYQLDSQSNKLSWYSTIYLAPHNYHRVHAPVSGELVQITYVPGTLWPVNKLFVKFMPKLFLRNERLIFEMKLDNGGTVYTVMVGALNVGRIVSPFWSDFATNSDIFKQEASTTLSFDSPRPVKVGEELGTFMLGSTVVLVFDDKSLEKFPAIRDDLQSSIRLGEDLIKAKK